MIQKLNTEQLKELLEKASVLITNHKHTAGQAVFKVLKDINPNLANLIQGSDKDPFYHNIRLGAFYRFICDEEAYDYFTKNK